MVRTSETMSGLKEGAKTMLKKMTFALVAGMVVLFVNFAQPASCGFAQQSTQQLCEEKNLAPQQNANPAANLDLRRLLLTQPELQALEGLGPTWTLTTLDIVGGAKDFDIFGSHLAVFKNTDNQKLEIRLHSFEKNDSATAEEKAKNFILARIKDAEQDKAVIECDPRKADNATTCRAAQELNKDITKADQCHCFARDVGLVRATSAARDGSANSIKLYFRLRGNAVSVELTNAAAQAVAPASPDSRDGNLLRAAIQQRTKLCGSPFIKPKA